MLVPTRRIVDYPAPTGVMQNNPDPPHAIETKPSFADLQQAAEWFATLHADDAGEAEHRCWRKWLDEDSGHRAAWKRVEAVNAEFGTLPSLVKHHVFNQNDQRRRKTIKTLLWLAATVTVSGSLGSSREVRNYIAALNAQYHTNVGETSRQQLTDGSTLWLNTASAADTDFSNKLRRIVLHRGELMIQTAQDEHHPARPLVVDTRTGRMQALGTRFLVRLDDSSTILTVLEGKVRITQNGATTSTVVSAGYRVRLTEDKIDSPTRADESVAAWSRNLLIQDGMRLDDFVAELGRYRRGYLSCAPEIGSLRLVGVYPLDDTDRVLHALEATLPVKVRKILPWWVIVEAASKAS